MTKYIDSPYKNIPNDLLSDYTMESKIPILNWWIDGTNTLEKQIWDDNYIDEYINRFSSDSILSKKQGKEPYGGASDMILKAILKYDIKQKEVAVLGSLLPWIESILLNFNNKVTTIEYNIPELKTDKLNVMSYWDFEKSSIQFDCVISYSSIEHSGLGRYGDPLNPNGDIETMNVIHNHLKKDGLMLFGAPIGKDALVWNAHRVYGKTRLPLIFSNFNELEWIGYNKESTLNSPLRNNGSQPLIILKNK